MTTRTESDSFGPIQVPADALWGAQTERSCRFFAIGERLPIRAMQGGGQKPLQHLERAQPLVLEIARRAGHGPADNGDHITRMHIHKKSSQEIHSNFKS